jgi:hypothetical protein
MLASSRLSHALRAVVCSLLIILACAARGWARDSFEGKPCDDHDPCTTEDRFKAGMCRGTPKDCDDALPCTVDFCDRATGRCMSGLRIDACLIEGVCRDDGESDPDNPCLVCRPSQSAGQWVETTTCDDGDPCTLDDRCHDGECQGSAYRCDAGSMCARSRCDGKGGCIDELFPGHCRIDGLCLRDGQWHPADPCLRCDPSAAVDRWTLATGPACPGGTCVDGKCLATLVIERAGDGRGRVIGPDFTCTDACARTVVPERRLDLTVVAESGSSFRGWRGACSGIAPCAIVPTGETRLTAEFVKDGEALE